MQAVKKTCAVLGSNGYIGRHMVHFLTEHGFEVLAYGHASAPHASLPNGIPYRQIDIRKKESVAQINFDVDFVFLFAGITGTKVSFDQYQLFTEVNEIGLLHVLDRICQLDKKPHLVFPSSRLVYKGSDNPLNEDAEKEAKTIYAANKLNCERFLETYKQQFNIPYTIFRICVPYGNLFDDNFSYGTIGFFLSKAKNDESIQLFGDGSLQRTFTYIEYLCIQILSCITQETSINSTYNVDGESFSLKDVAEQIANHYNVEVQYTEWPQQDWLLESGHTIFNANKILKLTGVQSSHTLKKWLSQQ